MSNINNSNNSNNNDENERKLQHERRVYHKERLRRCNYYARDTANVVVVTGLEELEKELNHKIYLSDLRYHFEREDPNTCYRITQMKQINDDNVVITFEDIGTARSAVLHATTIYIMGECAELDLRLIKTSNSNIPISDHRISKHTKRADIIDSMAAVTQ